jgi:DNA-binding NarL/FixJ family response regulator
MKVLVIDDHVLIRDALRGLFEELRPDAVVLESADAREAEQLAGAHPDLGMIMLDLGLPDGDGFELLQTLRDRYPAVAIVVLSAWKDRQNVTRALALGALGFIPKSATRAVMLSALQLIFSGGIYVPPEILAQSSDQRPDGQLRADSVIAHPSPSDLGVTERQLEVIALMMSGMSNKAICRKLDVAEATVKNHVTAVLKALKVTNRTEAVIAVTELGWTLPRRSAKPSDH